MSYGYSHSRLWRVSSPLACSICIIWLIIKLRISSLVAFGVALLFALLIFTELNLASAAETAVVPLKRRSKAAPGTAQDSMDEKKTASGCAPASTMVAETKRTHRGHLIRLYR